MAKEIYLIRHAKSSWENAGEIADVNRPLAMRGVRDASLMSQVLLKKKVRFDKIYSSHGIRALHTAVMITQGLKQNPEKIQICSELYLPLKSDILKVIQNCHKQANTIAIFAHDPGITDFAYNTEAKLEHVATTGIVHYILNKEHWANARMSNLEFQGYDFPKNYKTKT